MNPERVRRERVKSLTDLPNVGKATEEDLRLLGIEKPEDLAGRNPVEMYKLLCRKRGFKQDPCVLDIFMAITRFMEGERPRRWWEYSEERKRILKEDKGE